ncbi:MAG: glycine oxidase ThiO [Carbonactinosporaceae bacterium]
MHASARRAPDVVVVGGGVIGLAIAWQTSNRGLDVTVVDPAPGRGSSYAAAGMLTPVTELTYGEEALLRLNLASAARYPSFVAELEEAAGRPAGYREHGTLAVAFDNDDRAVLDDLRAFQASLGLQAQALTGRQCRRLEPLLAPSVRGGLLARDDRSIDNRMLMAALLAALGRADVPVLGQRVAELMLDGGRAAGVRLADGTAVPAAQVVLSAGCWSGELTGLPPGVAPPVRPVKGQILRLRVPPAVAPFLTRTVRATVRGSGVYLVPRAGGELVVGSTVEEMGFDTTVTAGGVYELLRDAHEIIPAVTELELVETLAGLRPGSPDNAPILGPAALPGLVLATGHFRNGILLTPVTADAVAELLTTGETPAVIAPFEPGRFTPGHRPPEEVPA